MAIKKKGCCLGCLFIVVIVLALIIGTIVSAPSVISSDGVRKSIVKSVNETLGTNGTLIIEGWSFSWGSGQTLTGLKFTDGTGNATVSLDSFDVSSGLLAMMSGSPDLGDVEILNPRVEVIIPKPKPGATNEVADAKDEAPKAEEAAEKKAASSLEPVEVPVDVKGSIKIVDGLIRVQPEGESETFEIRDLNVTVNIASLLKEPIEIDASANFGEGNGTFSFDAVINAVEDGMIDPNKVTVKIKLAIAEFALRPVMAVAKAMAPVPDTEGTVNVDIDITASGVNSLDAIGAVTVESLTLSGGPLGDDEPSFDKIGLNFKVGAKDMKTIDIETFTLDAPFANAKASGSLTIPEAGSTVPKGKIVCEAGLDISSLTEQVANTLEALGVPNIEGDVSVDLSIEGDGDEAQSIGTIALNALELSGGPLGNDRPSFKKIGFDYRVTAKDKTITIEKAAVTAPFAKIGAQGTVVLSDTAGALPKCDVVCKGRVDISKVTDQVSKLLEAAGAPSVDGTIGLNLKVEGGDADPLVSHGTIGIKNLELAGGPLGEDEPEFDKITFSYKVAVDDKTITLEKIALAAPFAKVDASGSLQIPKKTESEDKQIPDCSFQAKASLDLPALAAQFPNTLKLREGLSLDGGVASLNADIQSSKGKQTVNFDAGLADVAATVDGREVKVSPIDVKGAIVGDVAAKDFTIHGVNLTSDMAQFNCKGTLKQVNIDGKADLGKVLAEARKIVEVPETMELSGQLSLGSKIAMDGDVVSVSDTSVQIASLVFKNDGKELIEQIIKVEAACKADLKKTNLELEKLVLASSPANLSVAGTLNGWANTMDLALDGKIKVDFARLAELAEEFGGIEVKGSGAREEPFSIKASLKQDEWQDIFRGALVSAGIYADSFEAFGVAVSDLAVPVQVKDGVATIKLAASVNEGTLSAEPTIKLVGDKMVLAMPPNSKILDNVNLTDAMANDLLAKMHPFFRGCVVTAGKITFVMTELEGPLDETIMKELQINGSVSLSSLQLGPSGVLGDILKMVGQVTDSIPVGDRAFGFKCDDGRITADPLKIRIDGEYYTFGGSVGLDQTLDYWVDIPVTKGMVVAKAFEYLEGQTVRVPIGGTVTKPKLAEDVFTTIIGDLAEKALKRAASKAIENAIEKEAGKLLKGLF